MFDFVLHQSGLTIYISLFVLLIAGAVGLPMPEDVPLILGGIAAQSERAELEVVLVVCYIATLLGDLIIFGFGRKFGKALSKRAWFYARLPPEKIEELKKGLEKRSLFMIFVARHLFYLRTATFLTCGVVKMRVLRFLISDALAALVSVPIMVGLGYTFAENYDVVFSWISKAKELALVLGVLALIALLYYRSKKKRRKKV